MGLVGFEPTYWEDQYEQFVEPGRFYRPLPLQSRYKIANIDFRIILQRESIYQIDLNTNAAVDNISFHCSKNKFSFSGGRGTRTPNPFYRALVFKTSRLPIITYLQITYFIFNALEIERLRNLRLP